MSRSDRMPWGFVTALSVTQLVSYGTLFYAFALLIEPMERDLGWSKSALTAAYSLALVSSAFFAVPVGSADRSGLRPRRHDRRFHSGRDPAGALVPGRRLRLVRADLDRPRRLHERRSIRAGLRGSGAAARISGAARHHRDDADRRVCQHGLHPPHPRADRGLWLARIAAFSGRRQPGHLRRPARGGDPQSRRAAGAALRVRPLRSGRIRAGS